MKIGLVLEGGAMRGLYSEGILDVMMEHQICFDQIVGVSAGAIFGVNFLSKQQGRAVRYCKKYMSKKTFMGIIPLLKEGNIISTSLGYVKITHELDIFDNETYIKNSTPFYAVVTDVESGEAEYIHMKDVYEQLDVLRASGSMPFVSTPVKINGKEYLDGALSDSIPFAWLSTQCDKIVVILTRDATYRKKALSPLLIRLFYNKKKKLASKIKNMHITYHQQLSELDEYEKQGKAFIIRPSQEITISRLETDGDKLQAVYDLGRKDGEACIEALLAFMQNR